MKGVVPKRLSLWKELSSNPAAVAAFLLIAGIIIEQIAHHSYSADWLTISEIGKAIGEAMVVASLFGFIFEFFGRKRLIEEAVEQAAGQVRAVMFGLYDFVRSPAEIDYAEAFELSACLVISSRYSADALIPYRDQIINRLRNGKTITFICAAPGPMIEGINQQTSTSQSAREFFLSIIRIDPGLSKFIIFKETVRPFTYNFVGIDAGIWVKLYFNAKSEGPPPAFFAKRNSDLHKMYMTDINKLVEGSEEIILGTTS